MNNHSNKSNKNFFAVRNSRGVEFSAFNDIKTPPQVFNPIFRTFLESGQPRVQSRMFHMYKVLMNNTSGQPSADQGIPDNFINLIDGIFLPFINKDNVTCNVSNLTNLQELNKVRIALWRFMKRITSCDQVSVAFKTAAGTEAGEGISFYINDSNILEGSERFTYKISNHNFNLSDKASILVVIPVRYIQNTIEAARSKCSVKAHQNNGVEYSVADVMSEIMATEFKKILRNLIAAIYKESIFMNVAREMYATAGEIMKVSEDKWVNLSYKELEIESFVAKARNSDTNPFFNFQDIVKEMAALKIDRINPYSLLDLMEIRQKEIDFVSNLYIRSDKGTATAPFYYRLNLNQDVWIDNESKVSAAAVYMAKLNYTIIGLLVATNNSIRESVRSVWCQDLTKLLGIIDMYSQVSYISNNKKWLKKEIELQLNYLKELGENLIRLGDVRKVIS